MIPPFAVTTPANAALPVVTNTVATPEPTFSFDPSNVKLASSSSSPLDPAITTLLSVRSPIAAVSAARLSMFAVPSMCRSCHSLPAAPIFLLPSTSGIRLLPTDVNVDTPDMFSLLLVVTPLTLIPCGVVCNTFPLS